MFSYETSSGPSFKPRDLNYRVKKIKILQQNLDCNKGNRSALKSYLEKRQNILAYYTVALRLKVLIPSKYYKKRITYNR